MGEPHADHLALSGPPGCSRPGAIACGALAAVLALGWQFLTVRFNYGGNWTALFCAGARLSQPPGLASEHIYTFANSYGYDGQFYHYIAHDPLFQRGFSEYIDAPALRSRRILVPGLAWLLAAGRQDWIDAAYVAVFAGFVFLGAWWLARYALLVPAHPAWGLAFLLVPATLVSIDRLTVDVALAALTVAFALYSRAGSSWKLYPVLALAALARETGLLLVAGYCLWAVAQRQWLRAALGGAATLPALAWYVFVMRHVPDGSDRWIGLPFGGFVTRLVRPTAYPFPPAVSWLATALDYAALAGMLVALALGVRLLLRRDFSPAALTAVLFTLLGVVVRFPVWEDAYAFGRAFSPLLLLLALGGFASRSWWTASPLAMILPRVALQMSGQVLGVVRGLFLA